MPDAAIAQSLPRAEAGVGGDLRQIPPAQPDAPETKHERFLRLAPGRVQKALDALDRIAQLSLPGNEYSEAEAARIVCALRARLTEVEHKLSRKKPEKRVFSFD